MSKKEFLYRFRLHTDPRKTEDEYFALLSSVLRDRISLKSIQTSVVSSVVPHLTKVIMEVCGRLTHNHPILLGPALFPYLPIAVLSPHEIGSDLVANALEAYLRCEQSCIVVDFGTALTFTAIQRKGEQGEIVGVAIAPGLGSAAKTLSSQTAQLFEVDLVLPSSVLGKNTIHAIQSGIMHGYVGLVKHLVTEMKAGLQGKVRVFATGGLTSVLQPILEKNDTPIFDEVDPDLTLKGLYQVTRFARHLMK